MSALEPDWLHIREAESDDAYDEFDRDLDRADRLAEYGPSQTLRGEGVASCSGSASGRLRAVRVLPAAPSPLKPEPSS